MFDMPQFFNVVYYFSAPKSLAPGAVALKFGAGAVAHFAPAFSRRPVYMFITFYSFFSYQFYVTQLRV